MIARTWKGQTTRENAPAYLQHLTGKVLPELRQIHGFRGTRVLRRDLGHRVEFMVITHWESWEAIRAFAGQEPQTAVVAPAARELLAEFDDFVSHFDIAHQD
ncbi:MAG TPA: antibiotic biosynthesis monooxygenase [Steroidobacteraceae bacterium]|jgi:heme-degrading monooxygenase HmoA